MLRSVFYKYLHPKEVFIADGILVPDIARKKNTTVLAGSRKTASKKESAPEKKIRGQAPQEKLGFVYPYGVSLNVDVSLDDCYLILLLLDLRLKEKASNFHCLICFSARNLLVL